jgi:hypothetical protein
MKKWLPTLLPILGTVITAVLPQVQHLIINFVSAHPAWSSVITALGLVVNHQLNPPGAAPSDYTVAKIGTSMLCIALVLGVFFTTGCSYSQAEVVVAVQKVEIGLKTAKGILPAASTIAQELAQTGNAEAAEYLNNFVSVADPALDKLIAASETYIGNPGNDNYQALLNGLDAFTSQVDQQALKLAGLKNPQSQQKAVAWIALVSTSAHVVLAIAENYATNKQKKATAAAAVTARLRFDQIRPFLKRDYARQELSTMGYSNPDQLLEYAGL